MKNLIINDKRVIDATDQAVIFHYIIGNSHWSSSFCFGWDLLPWMQTHEKRWFSSVIKPKQWHSNLIMPFAVQIRFLALRWTLFISFIVKWLPFAKCERKQFGSYRQCNCWKISVFQSSQQTYYDQSERSLASKLIEMILILITIESSAHIRLVLKDNELC